MADKSRLRCLFFVLAALALALRLGIWVIHFYHGENFIQPDTGSYLEPGRQLLANGSFPDFSRLPGYLLFLAFFYDTLGLGAAGTSLVQIALSFSTTALIGLLGRSLFAFGTGCLALFFIAFDLPSVLSANHLLSETPFTFLLLICLGGLLYLVYKQGSRSVALEFAGIALIGIGFSLLTFFRPIACWLFVPVSLWLAFTWQSRERRHRAALICCFCLFSILPPLLWMVRNHVHTGHFFLTTITATNLYEYRAAWNMAQSSERPFVEVQEGLRRRAARQQAENQWNEGDLAEWKTSRALGILAGDPVLTLRQGLDGMVKMYFGIANSALAALAGGEEEFHLQKADRMIVQRLQGLFYGGEPPWVVVLKIWSVFHLLVVYSGIVILLLMNLSGGRNHCSRTQRQFICLLLLIVGYFTFFSVGAEAYSRFRVPVSPLLTLLAGMGWYLFLRNISSYSSVLFRRWERR